MKNTIIKRIITGLFALILCFTFTGCSSSSTDSTEKKFVMEVNGIGDYEISSIPDGTVSGGVDSNGLTVNLNKEGNYKFVLKGEDGQEHTFTLKYHDGKAKVKNRDQIMTIDLKNAEGE